MDILPQRNFITGQTATRHFATWIFFSKGQFVTWTVCHMDSLSHRQFVTWTVCHMDSLLHGQFVTWTVCHMDSLSHGQIVTWTACHTRILSLQHFVSLDLPLIQDINN